MSGQAEKATQFEESEVARPLYTINSSLLGNVQDLDFEYTPLFMFFGFNIPAFEAAMRRAQAEELARQKGDRQCPSCPNHYDSDNDLCKECEVKWKIQQLENEVHLLKQKIARDQSSTSAATSNSDQS